MQPEVALDYLQWWQKEWQALAAQEELPPVDDSDGGGVHAEGERRPLGGGDRAEGNRLATDGPSEEEVGWCFCCQHRMRHIQALIPSEKPFSNGEMQQRIKWSGYSIKAARNRMPETLCEALAEAMVLAWDRD